MPGAPNGRALPELLARKNALELRERCTPELAVRVRELRAWQALRVARTYADLRSAPRYRFAVEFFLSDVYGPQDFGARTRNLEHSLAHLQPLLPETALRVLLQSIELDALTAELDHAMAEQVLTLPLCEAAYATAYRAVGQAATRSRQLDLLLGVVADLEAIARHAWTGVLLRAARLPAQVAGFGQLQDFLERGFVAFERMRGAEELLRVLQERETRFMQTVLFAGE